MMMRTACLLLLLAFCSTSVGQDFSTRKPFAVPQRGSGTTEFQPKRAPLPAPATIGQGSQSQGSSLVRVPVPNQKTQQQEGEGFGQMGEVTSDYAIIDHCFAQLLEDIDVPAEESGKLTLLMERDASNNLVLDSMGKPQIMMVRRGRPVRKGEVIAKIGDERPQMMLKEASLRLSQAEARGTDDTSINAASKKHQLAIEEFNDTERLYGKGHKSKTEYKRAAYSMQIARLELTAARNEQMLALMDSQTQSVAVEAAQASIGRHAITSPVDGYVFELNKDPGEWVQAGETVLRIASMERLKIQGYVDSTQFNPHEIDGREVTAYANLANGEVEEFTGKVTFVSMENYSDKFEIEVEIENRAVTGANNKPYYILRAGSEVQVKIHLGNRSVAQNQENSSSQFGR